NFFHDEANVLGRHGSAATEYAANACIPQVHFFRQGFEQLRGGEQTAHAAVLEDRDRLVYDVIHIGTCVIELLVADDLFNPARIEVDEVAGASTYIRQMFNSQ